MNARREANIGGTPEGARTLLARGFTWVEDVAYIGLGLTLSASALLLLGTTIVDFWHDVSGLSIASGVVSALDRLLLVLVIIELLYTIQVSFREHALVPEPFLIVGLIAVTRRILVLTAESAGLPGQQTESTFRVSMIELAVLTLMVVALVASLVMLGKRHPGAVAPRQ
jgi:uncharacterized membrane protein (DUF373 family)